LERKNPKKTGKNDAKGSDFACLAEFSTIRIFFCQYGRPDFAPVHDGRSAFLNGVPDRNFRLKTPFNFWHRLCYFSYVALRVPGGTSVSNMNA